jgi:Leucine-rich repeat (LRR) protein
MLSIYSYARHLFPLPSLTFPKVDEILVDGRLKKITPDVKLLKVRSLRFRFMKLKKIPVELFQSPTLTDLTVTENLLDQLPLLKSSNNTLTHLDLTQNKLATLPKTFHLLNNLQHLTLAKNSFKDLNTFPRITTLKSLNLMENKLMKLNPIVDYLQNLETINCYNNNIVEVSDEITLLKKLRVLDLRLNPIDPARIAWLRETMPNTKVLHY